MAATISDSFADPSLEILSLQPLKISNLTKDQELIKFTEQYPLPTISPQIIDTLKSSNDNKNGGINQILIESMENFPFNSEIVNYFLQKPCYTVLETEISFYYILYSFVSWRIQCLQKRDIEASITIFEALTYLSSTIESDLPSLAFLFGITLLFNHSDFIDFSIFIPIIRSFFLDAISYPETAFSLFPRFICRLMSNRSPMSVIEDFLQLLKQVLSIEHRKYPASLSEETLIALSPFISKLDKTPIHIFLLLAPSTNPQFVTTMLSSLAVIIADSALTSIRPITLPQNRQKIVRYPIPDHSLGIMMHFHDAPTFIHGLDLNTVNIFQEEESIEAFFDSEMISKLKLLLMIMNDNEKYSNEFGKSLLGFLRERSKDENILKAYIVTIYSFHTLRMKGCDVPSICGVFINNLLFDPGILCDSTTVDLNSIRSACLELFALEGPHALLFVLHWALEYPDLFSEFLCRIIANFKTYAPAFASSTDLVRLMANALLYYQKFRLDGEEHIDDVRLTLFLFLSHCFNVVDVAKNFFSDTIFIRSFLSLIFEKPIRSFIFSQLRHLYTFNLPEQQHNLSDVFASVFKSIKLEFPDPKSIELATMILELLCSVVNYQNNSVTKTLATIVPYVFKGLTRLDSSELSAKLILIMIQFLTEVSIYFTFEKFHFQILHNSIQKAFLNQSDLHPQLYGNIVRLIAGERLSTETTSIISRHPFGIWLLLKTFYQTSKFVDALTFVTDICEYHSYNCKQCRKGEVDLLLISIIKETNDQISIEDKNKCFNLLVLITSHFSSPAVIEQYVSMFQFEGENSPPYFQPAIRNFISMLTSYMKVPQTMTNLVKTAKIEPTSFDFNVQNGFTLVFWLYLERCSPQYYPSIISMQDQNGHYFHLFVASDSLRVSHHENPLDKSEKVQTRIQLKQWSFIAVTYRVIPPSYYVLPTVNDSGDEIIEKKSKKALNGQIKLQIGGSLSDPIDSDIPCILGPIAFYNVLSENNITDIFSKGINGVNDQSTVTPLYIYNVNNRIHNQTPRFPHVLTVQVGLSILFPLFNVSDSIFDSSFEAFLTSLMSDESVEIEFANSDYFSMIAYLLKEKVTTKTSYQLYLKFFSLMMMLQTETLKQQLFDSIMVNFDIWIRADIDNLHSIVKHWCRTLYPSFVSCVSTMMPFALLLNQFIIYFDDNDFLNVKIDFSHPKATKCKKLLIQLLQYVATVSFTSSDCQLLMSYIEYLEGKELAIDLANLLRDIIHLDPSIVQSFASNQPFLAHVHSLLRIPKVCSIAIDSICYMLSNSMITNVTLAEETALIINSLPENVIDQTLFGIVVQQTVYTPAFFPLCCYICKVLGDQSTMEMIKLFSESPDYVDDIALFYPCVAAYFLGKEARSVLLSFVANCSYEKWINLYLITFVIDNIFDNKSRDLEKDLIDILADILANLDNLDTNIMNQYVLILKNFIFLRNIDEENSILSDKTSHAFLQNNKINIPFSEIISKFTKFTFEDLNLVYGLRFSENNEWEDENLAMKIIMLFEKKEFFNALSLEFVLAFYLTHHQLEFVKDHFGSYSMPKQPQDKIELYAALLNRKLQQFGIESTLAQNFKNLKYDDNIFEIFIKSIPQFTLQLVKPIQDCQIFLNHCLQIETELEMIQSDRSNPCTLAQTETLFSIISKSLKNEKRWNDLNCCLTLPFAPWHKNMAEEIQLVKSMRLCGFGFPALYKNKSFKKNLWDAYSKEIKYVNDSNHLIPGDFISRKVANIFNDKLGMDIEQIPDMLLETDPSSLMMVPVHIYKSSGIVNAKIFISHDAVTIFYNVYKSRKYNIKDITEINAFKIDDKDIGIELFMKDGRSLLVNFMKKSLKEIAMNILQNHITYEQNDIFKLWIKRSITTFEFLIKLNRKLYRSFNYPKQAPVFPSFLMIDDYSTQPIDNNKKALKRHKSVSFNEIISDYNDEVDNILIGDTNIDDFRSSISSDYQLLLQKQSMMKQRKRKNSSVSPSIENPSLKSHSNRIPPFLPGSLTRVSPFLDTSTENSSSIYSSHLYSSSQFSLQKISTSTSNTTIGSVPNFELESNSDVSEIRHSGRLKLSGILKVLSDGGTSSIDYYTTHERFYERRKILESDDVSANLNLWLSKTFNISIPIRNVRTSEPIQPIFIKSNVGLILHASISFTRISMSDKENQETLYSIHMIGKDGQLTQIKIEFSKTFEASFDTTTTPISNFDGNWNQVRSLSNNFVIYLGQNRKLYSYNKSKDEITLLEQFPVTCFTTSDSYLLMAPETSSIHIFTANDLRMPINIHKFYQSPALCSAISESFHTVVIGSQGRLIIAPLENGSSMMTINIQDYTPLQILITQNFGFVVTYAMKIENAAIVKVILLHSLAGKLLHVKDIDFDLDLMVDWTDCDGIDFLAVSDTSGQIFASEAYDLSLSFVIQRCLSPIISMKYCKELKSLIAITTNGNIFIDPVNINATIY